MYRSSPPKPNAYRVVRAVVLVALVVALAACGTVTGQPTAGAQVPATISPTAPRSPAPATAPALATPTSRRAATGSASPATAMPVTPAPSPTLRLVTPGVRGPVWSSTPVLVLTLAVTPTPNICPTPIGTPRITPEPEATCADAMRRSLTHPPSFVLVEAIGGVLVVQWEYTGIGGGHYDVYRQTVPDGAWQLVGSVPLVTELERPPNGGTYAWRDPGAQAGMTYRYGVVTINSFGLHGPMMISALVTAP